MRVSFATLGIVIAGMFAGASAVDASVTVSPTRIVLQGKPSKVLVGFYTVENREASSLTVSVEPEDWGAGLSGGRGAVAWLTVKPTTLTLQPGKRAKVKYVVRIPKDASGELRAQVFFTTTSSGGSTLSLRSRLGTILYVAIEGTEHLDAAITKVRAFYTASSTDMPRPDRLEVVIGIQNRSNVHIVPQGAVVLYDEQRRAVATVELPAGWGLLPNEDDTYHAVGHGIHLPPGRYTVELAITVGADIGHPITVTQTLAALVSEDGSLRLLDAASPAP